MADINKNHIESESYTLELSDLEVFKIVADENSISHAAKRLNYVQSNVTVRIKRLETELQT
ncbi:helix-turn-helix domain-containing protein [Priestia filamentosa]|uniref:helix-turn-helix domain-containing protein n=1 Tax=Priestia filamentosa TaxID=1402861 RepID=UPI0020A67A55|nr:LysR family transcriptional regulator [Priestia filamentosa]